MMKTMSKFTAITFLLGLLLNSMTVLAQAEGSKFSKLKLEMARAQVTDLIGQPTDSKTYETGKRWIPYYHGSDSRRTELFYKNEGRLTIGGNGRVIKITVDTSEDGYQ